MSEQNQQAVAKIIKEAAAQNLTDVAKMAEDIAALLPDTADMGDIAIEIAAQNALSGILDDSLLDPLAQAFLTEIIDDSLKKPLLRQDSRKLLLTTWSNPLPMSIKL